MCDAQVYLNTDDLEDVRTHGCARWWSSLDGSPCLLDDFVADIRELTDRLAWLRNNDTKGAAHVGYNEEHMVLLHRFLTGCLNVKPEYVALAQLASNSTVSPDPEKIFTLFDSNGDGTVSEQEWGDTIRSTGVDIPEHEIKELWKLIDKNDSGVVDIQELGHFLRGGKAGDTEEGEALAAHVAHVLDGIVPACLHFIQKVQNKTKTYTHTHTTHTLHICTSLRLFLTLPLSSSPRLRYGLSV